MPVLMRLAKYSDLSMRAHGIRRGRKAAVLLAMLAAGWAPLAPPLAAQTHDPTMPGPLAVSNLDYKFNSIQILIVLATEHDLELHQMDIKMAFLNGNLDEEIYMEQPEGFAKKGQECKVSI